MKERNFSMEKYWNVLAEHWEPRVRYGSNPAILCSHGHGSFGKDTVAGMKCVMEHMENIQACNYNYAEQMAMAGFLTIAPDLRGFGERSDGRIC